MLGNATITINLTGKAGSRADENLSQANDSRCEGIDQFYTNFTPSSFDTNQSVYEHVLIILALLITGYTGNALVIFAYRKRTSDVTRAYVLLLAALDIFSLTFLLPHVALVNYYTDRLSIVMKLFWGVLSTISTMYVFPLVGLACERSLVLWRPLDFRRNVRIFRRVFAPVFVIYAVLVSVFRIVLNIKNCTKCFLAFSKLNLAVIDTLLVVLFVLYVYVIFKIRQSDRIMLGKQATLRRLRNAQTAPNVDVSLELSVSDVNSPKQNMTNDSNPREQNAHDVNYQEQTVLKVSSPEHVISDVSNDREQNTSDVNVQAQSGSDVSDLEQNAFNLRDQKQTTYDVMDQEQSASKISNLKQTSSDIVTCEKTPSDAIDNASRALEAVNQKYHILPDVNSVNTAAVLTIEDGEQNTSDVRVRSHQSAPSDANNQGVPDNVQRRRRVAQRKKLRSPRAFKRECSHKRAVLILICLATCVIVCSIPTQLLVFCAVKRFDVLYLHFLNNISNFFAYMICDKGFRKHVTIIVKQLIRKAVGFYR